MFVCGLPAVFSGCLFTISILFITASQIHLCYLAAFEHACFPPLDVGQLRQRPRDDVPAVEDQGLPFNTGHDEGHRGVGHLGQLPADQLLPAQPQQEGAAAEGAAQGGSGSEDRNVPWRLRKKQKRTDKKHKKHKQSKWEAAAGPKAAAAADAAAASAAAAKKGGSAAGGAAEEEIEEDEELGNTVEADLSEFEAEGAPPVPLPCTHQQLSEPLQSLECLCCCCTSPAAGRRCACHWTAIR